MSRDSKFWDRIAPGYARRPVSDEVSYQRKLEVTRGYLRPDMEVLEIGCGTGSTALVHAPHVRHIRATDISPKMIEIARGKAETAGVTNLDFDVAAIDDLQVANQSLDMVMGHSILHLLADKDAAIDRAYAMLKPGGVFVTSTVCLGDRMKWFKIVGPIGYFLRLIPLVKVFNVQQLVDSLIRAGLRIEHQWQPGDGRTVFIVAKKA